MDSIWTKAISALRSSSKSSRSRYEIHDIAEAIKQMKHFRGFFLEEKLENEEKLLQLAA